MISSCDLNAMIYESVRFMFQIILVHVISHSIDGVDSLINKKIIIILFSTVLAVIIYHLLFKKIVDYHIKNEYDSCNNRPKQPIHI